MSDGTMEVSFGRGNSFKEIVMFMLHKVSNLACVEMRGGYYTTAESKQGTEKEIYVQDTREVFINGVKILKSLVLPKFDKEIKEKYIKIEEKLRQIKKIFIDASSIEEEVILGEGFYEDPNDKVLLETYKQMKLELYMELFEEISKLLSRLNYLEIGGATY